MTNESLLYPAYQKLYSALCSLDRFNTQNDFFDNVSSLDTFFSEFRNITFVLQKSLAHTEFLSIYNENRTEYFKGLKWFVDKRNETIKQKPFQLRKQIEIIEYFPYGSKEIISHIFSAENDKDLCFLLSEIKCFFLKRDESEYFFSVDYTFFENNSPINICDMIFNGIKSMRDFLLFMESIIKERCDLCDKIKEKTLKVSFIYTPRSIFHTTDYVYYPKNNEFVIGEFQAFKVGIKENFNDTTVPRMKIENFFEFLPSSENLDYFQKFILMHIVQQNVDLMPAFAFVYEDETFELDTFHSTIKTTFYRMIYNISKNIIKYNIKEIYLMMTYTHYLGSNELFSMTSEERKNTKEKHDELTFIKINNKCESYEYRFSKKELSCLSLSINKLISIEPIVEIASLNILPILKAFKSIM